MTKSESKSGEKNPMFGKTPWNKGTKGVMKKNSGSFKKGKLIDEKHPLWKGKDAGYTAIHQWIRRKFGSPKKCEDCGSVTAKKFEWANISGLYKRLRSDWKRLCTKCHHKLDKIAERGWETKKKKS